MFKGYGGCDAGRVEAFEELLGFQLPTSYRNFLMAENGGSIRNCVVNCDTIGDIRLDVLFGLGLTDSLDLKFWHAEYRSELPAGCFLIGSTPGGMFILLGTDGELSGGYIYDPACEHKASSDEANTFYLCSDFSELCDKVAILGTEKVEKIERSKGQP